MAVWRYCEQSVNHIFWSKLGDSVADTILRELRSTPTGLTRTDISNLLGRNHKASRIDTALEELESQQLIRLQSEPSAGRSATRVFAV
jgi:predicted transcriptional regulator